MVWSGLPAPDDEPTPPLKFLYDELDMSMAAGQKRVDGQQASPPYQETFLDQMTAAVDRFMDSPVGDAIANVGMITTAMTCPGIIADAYLYEMCVEGKSFWESIETNGFCKTVSNMVDSTISEVKETWEDKVIKDRI